MTIFLIIIILLVSVSILNIEPVVKSGSSGSSSGGTPVRNEFIWNKNPDQIVNAAQMLLDNLDKYRMIHEWIFVTRQSRHPGFLWEIDYIKPTKSLIAINKMVTHSENILFDSKNSIILKPEFSADIGILNLFNIIRAYIKAENNSIEDSMEIWNAIYKSQIGYLSITRQSNILCHMHSAFLCTGNFEKSFSCFMKHLALLKTTTHKNQHACGLWDNISIMHIMQCFFSKYVPQYRTFLSQNIGSTERSFLTHKKTALLKFMSIQLIVQICSKPFYDHAKINFPNLPNYDESSFITSSPTKQQEASTFYEMKYKQMLCDDSEYVAKDELKAIEWSIWHEKEIQFKKEMQYKKGIQESPENERNVFIDFLTDINIDCHSIVDIGCGISDKIYNHFSDKNIIGVDISPFVVDYWAEKGRQIIKTPADIFFEQCDKKFDICTMLYVLPAIQPIDKFLRLCSQNCKNLCTIITLGMWLRPNPIGISKLALTIQDEDEWVKQISKYFEIMRLEDDTDFLMIHAVSKNI